MGGFGRRDNLLDNLDQYNERFKESMKAKFQSSFVASGIENKARKEATVTFIKKGAEQTKETISLSEYKAPDIPTTSNQMNWMPPELVSSKTPTNFVNRATFDITKLGRNK